MTTHVFEIEHMDDGYRWICSCGSRGAHGKLDLARKVVDDAFDRSKPAKKRKAIAHVKPAARRKRREKVYIRDAYTCQGCFEVFPADQLTLDHIKPACLGGSNRMENLQAMCFPCNQAKADDDWSVD